MKTAGRVLLLVLLVRWTLLFLLWPMRDDVVGSSFLHVISIPFHEAGHVIFAPFGDLMMSLGGSLNQILIPVVCLVAFLQAKNFNPFAAAVMLWWAGQNFVDVAIYINDARSLKLILLGGHTGAEVEGHDWERILQLTGLLHRDHQIAWTAHIIGAVLMAGGIIWAAVVTWQSHQEDNQSRSSLESTQRLTRQPRYSRPVDKARCVNSSDDRDQ
jgi:hypothetical protein